MAKGPAEPSPREGKQPKAPGRTPSQGQRAGWQLVGAGLLKHGCKRLFTLLGHISGGASVDLRPPEVTQKRARPPRARQKDVPYGGSLAEHVGGRPPTEGVPGGGKTELTTMSSEVGKEGGGKAENRSRFQLPCAAVVRHCATKSARAAKEPGLRVRAA